MSFIIAVSVFSAGAPSVNAANTFSAGQEIFLDASYCSQWWTNYCGETYYTWMFLYCSGKMSIWTKMYVVSENPNRVILKGTVPTSADGYTGLIFTRQRSDNGDWPGRTNQTVDISWDGSGICYVIDSDPGNSINNVNNLTGYWKNETPVVDSEGAYNIALESSDGTVTAKADNRIPGTADEGDIVRLKITCNTGYFLNKVTVVNKAKESIPLTRVSEYEYTFVMPAEKVTAKVTYYFNKRTAFSGDVFWIDTQPDVDDSPIGLVKWTNRKGNGSGTTSTYTLYVPGGIDLHNVRVYYGSGALTINGETVSKGGLYSFTNGQSYDINGKTMRIMQSDSASVYIKTPSDLTVGKIGEYGDY